MSDQENYWTRHRSNRFTRRTFMAGSGVMAAGTAAMLAGCGDDDVKKTATAASGTTVSGATNSTPQASSATAAASGKRGGKLTVTKVVPDTGLDPAITVTNPMHPAKAYNHILQYEASSNTFYLDAASKFEQADPTKMVFTLRDGMKFNPEAAGGRALTAADVAYSYARFPGTLKNFGSEVNSIQWAWMDSFETPDDKTLIIKLKKPYASAIPVMGSSAYGIVAKELVEANGGSLAKIMNAGAGPYMMTKRESTGTRYERNPNYYKHSPALGPFVEAGPYIDVIEEIITQDPATVEARFLAGDTDFLNLPQGIDKLKAAELQGQKGIVVGKATTAANYPITLDNEKWDKHPKLREAFSLAIDRELYIKTILLGDGIYGSSVGPIFDSVLSQEELKGLQKFDPVRAKQLWAEGGGNTVFPNGLLTIPPTFGNQTPFAFVQKQLEANLGIKVKLDPADLAAFVARATSRQKDWDFFISSEGSITTIPDYNALTFFAPSGYASIFGNLRLDSPIPETAAFAKECQDWYDKQAAELDPAKRKQILRDAQKFHLTSFGPAIPLPVSSFVYGAWRDRVKNVPLKDFHLGNSSTGVYRVHNLSVA